MALILLLEIVIARFYQNELLLTKSTLARHTSRRHFESSQSSSYDTASTSFHQEDEDTTSDYFSQGVEDAEEEVSRGPPGRGEGEGSRSRQERDAALGR